LCSKVKLKLMQTNVPIAMNVLKNERITLRAMEPADIDLMYQWENDPETWIHSNTQTPFSRFHLEQYVLTSHCNIYTDKQLRLIITDQEDVPAGCADLFDFDAHNRRAGVGILIAPSFRRQGYASETLDILIDYARNTLFLNQLFCSIASNNQQSINLFTSKGFVHAGTRKQWIMISQGWEDEHFFQLIL